MEKIKTYQISKRVNQFGYRLKLEYSIEANYKNEFSIIFKDSIEWEDLKYFKLFFNSGAAYFYDKYKKGFEIVIHDIHYMPVDTSYMLIMYGVIEALSDFFDFPIENLRIEEGCFVIPR